MRQLKSFVITVHTLYKSLYNDSGLCYLHIYEYQDSPITNFANDYINDTLSHSNDARIDVNNVNHKLEDR